MAFLRIKITLPSLLRITLLLRPSDPATARNHTLAISLLPLSKFADNIVSMDWNNWGRDSRMVEVAEHVSLLCDDTPSLGESSVDVFNEIELIEFCIFVRLMVKSHLTEAISIRAYITKVEELCCRLLDIKVDEVPLATDRHADSKKDRNQQEKNTKH